MSLETQLGIFTQRRFLFLSSFSKRSLTVTDALRISDICVLLLGIWATECHNTQGRRRKIKYKKKRIEIIYYVDALYRKCIFNLRQLLFLFQFLRTFLTSFLPPLIPHHFQFCKLELLFHKCLLPGFIRRTLNCTCFGNTFLLIVMSTSPVVQGWIFYYTINFIYVNFCVRFITLCSTSTSVSFPRVFNVFVS